MRFAKQEDHMDQIFWLGQIFWLAFLACGIYLWLVYARLADEESARTVKPDVPAAKQPHTGSAGFDLSQGSNA
jgi:predicted permease